MLVSRQLFLLSWFNQWCTVETLLDYNMTVVLYGQTLLIEHYYTSLYTYTHTHTHTHTYMHV